MGACVAARWRDGGGRNGVVVLWWRAQEPGQGGKEYALLIAGCPSARGGCGAAEGQERVP